MAVGRIDFLDKNGEITMSMEYESWDKMSAQIALEDQFGDPFVAHVYSYDELNFELKSPNSKVKYLQKLVPDGAEQDRFWIDDNEIVAIYWNPNGGPDGFGDYLEHHFSYERILECDRAAGYDEEFSDLLYGDASNTTFCIDIGTDAFESVSKEFSSGFRPNDNSFTGIREWMVGTAKAKLAERNPKILKAVAVLKLPKKAGEKESQTLKRAKEKLSDSGFDVVLIKEVD